MASTKPKTRRDSIMSHRQRPSIHNSISLNDPPPLPPPVTLHPFVHPSDTKHGLLPISLVPPTLLSAARRSRIRPSLIALLTLLTLAAFCVLHQHLNDSPSLSFSSASQIPLHSASDRTRHRIALTRPPRPPKITLAPDEELAAIVAFIAALPSNALPNSIDPMAALDPDLVLDFDTRSPKAAHEVRELVEDTWTRLPVVLFSNRYSPFSREVKAFLTEYKLNPSPVIFEIDDRADQLVLTPLISRLTGAADLPILLLGGQAVGSIDTIRQLHASGGLRNMVSATGAIVDGAKKKKGRRAAAQRFDGIA